MADGNQYPRRDEGPFSKRDLLEIAVNHGAIYTAVVDGDEQPFDGARFYASELELEGCFRRLPESPTLHGVEYFALWTPTELGKKVVRDKK